jgi:SAM-dependent methyltransferase
VLQVRHKNLETVPRQFTTAEQMDDPAVDPIELRRALRFIRRINAALGYNRAVLRALRQLGCGRGNTLLDIATGSADLPAALQRQGVQAIGIDRHAETLAVAAEWAHEVPLIRGDALHLPLPDQSIDFVTANLFLHHLPEAAAVAVLVEMKRVARRGIVVADLLPGRRPLAWITLFTLLSPPMVRHDARTSVRQAFPLNDARRLAAAAGLERATVRRTFGHRFLMTWRR